MAKKRAAKLPEYRNPKSGTEKRVRDLLKRMTLEEKADQLMQIPIWDDYNPNNKGMGAFRPTIGSILNFNKGPRERNAYQRQAVEETRLGIPIIWGSDIIHGLWTVFPIPLAQAASFAPEIARQCCAVAARESAALGLNWTFAPMVDVCRDARWGRIAEGYGEDPLVAGIFGAASVRGFQGRGRFDPRVNIAACLKHFAGYGFGEGGRDYCYSDISRLTLWETVLPPFQAGVEAGAFTLMSSFNDITGTPAVCNRYTLTKVLRKMWGFEGFVVSDWAAIRQLEKQGCTADPEKQTTLSLTAGNDMDMTDEIFQNIPALVRAKKLPKKVVDEAVRRVLRVKFHLGLFEQPYAAEPAVEVREPGTDDLVLAERAAAESFVLLKNEQSALPLKKGLSNLALLGPTVADKWCMKGMWGGPGPVEPMTTIEAGMREKLPAGCRLLCAPACDFEGDDRAGWDAALAKAKEADAVVLCLGEPYNGTGEDRSRANIRLHGLQEDLVRAVAALGKPVTLVISAGRPLDLSAVEPLVAAILYIWQPGMRGGAAVADVLLGNINPSGKLPLSFPRTAGMIPTHYNRRPHSRNEGFYTDLGKELSTPLWPFGFGLSYTRFEYSPVILSRKKLKADATLTAKVRVRNTGTRSGRETVFWYVRDPEASISQPLQRLIGFEKFELAPGGEKVVCFKVHPQNDLAFVNEDGVRILEPGRFLLWAGNVTPVEFRLMD